MRPRQCYKCKEHWYVRHICDSVSSGGGRIRQEHEVPHNYLTWFAPATPPLQPDYTILVLYAPNGKVVRSSYMCRWCYEDCPRNPHREFGTFDQLRIAEDQARRTAENIAAGIPLRSTAANAVLPSAPLVGAVEEGWRPSIYRPGWEYNPAGARYRQVRLPPTQQRPTGRAADGGTVSPGEGGGLQNVGALTPEAIAQGLQIDDFDNYDDNWDDDDY